MSRRRKALIAAAVIVIGIVFAAYQVVMNALEDPFIALFDENCSVCHGENLEGTPQGTPLLGVDLIHGDTMAEISKSIAEGFGE